jgi:hypothetical protein
MIQRGATLVRVRSTNLGRAGGKHGNVRVVVDGIKFASKREAARYQALKLLERAGRVRNLRLQVTYRFVVNGMHVCSYRADFVYEELVGVAWAEVVDDAKGYPNDVYPIKKKLMLACFGITVRES